MLICDLRINHEHLRINHENLRISDLKNSTHKKFADLRLRNELKNLRIWDMQTPLDY
jgi:hypothetical protein